MKVSNSKQNSTVKKIVNAAKKGKTVFTCSLGSRNIRSEKLANAYIKGIYVSDNNDIFFADK